MSSHKTIDKHQIGASRIDPPLSMDQYFRKTNIKPGQESISLPQSRVAELRKKQMHLFTGVDEGAIESIPPGLLNTVTEMYKNNLKKKLQEKGTK